MFYTRKGGDVFEISHFKRSNFVYRLTAFILSLIVEPLECRIIRSSRNHNSSLFVLTGCCSVAGAISTNEALTSAAPIAELADGAVQAAKTESPLPPPQSMNLESSPSDQQQIKTQDDQILPLKGPKFVPEASKNITALAGRVASLNCRIKNLDNWTVKCWVAVLFRLFCLHLYSTRYGKTRTRAVASLIISRQLHSFSFDVIYSSFSSLAAFVFIPFLPRRTLGRTTISPALSRQHIGGQTSCCFDCPIGYYLLLGVYV